MLAGGDGNDSLTPSRGTNQVSGGNGVDGVFYLDNVQAATAPFSFIATPVNVSLDGAANDGYAGNNSNIATDVEDVFVTDNNDCTSFVSSGGSTCSLGDATLTGSSGDNALSGGSGNDTITGGGGADFLSGNAGNDTINASDGYPDRVGCGIGTDTANVDQLDSTFDCEAVNTSQLTNIGLTPSTPPTISWASPGRAAHSTSAANALNVNLAALTRSPR